MMKCPDCRGKLEIVRACRKVAMKCGECGREYRIHEVADQIDEEAEEALGRWTAIVYD